MIDPEFSYTLAIESAVAGGSIALFRGRERLGGWLGPADVSRAEDLLMSIDLLLGENKVSARDLQLIAVSAGPGSFTGIRIGLATAMGLKAGIGIPMSSISVLTAMAMTWKQDGRVTPAVPVGRNAICCQTFEMRNGSVEAVDEPHTSPVDGFWRDRDAVTENSILLAHTTTFEVLSDQTHAVDIGRDLASAVAMACFDKPGSTVEPLFVSRQF